MYYPDNSFYSYFLDREVKSIKNMGWLDVGHEFKRGPTDKSFQDKLLNILTGNKKSNSLFNVFRGIYCCQMCGGAEVAHPLLPRDVLGKAECLIPESMGRWYFASPTLIYHYIVEHNYIPAADFVDSVLRFDLAENYSAQDIYYSLVNNNQGGA